MSEGELVLVLKHFKSWLGLPLGLEAPVIMPNSVIFLSSFFLQRLVPWLCLQCRVDCCLYAVNMGYHSSVGNSTAAVTTDNNTAIAISCPTTTPVQWQTADLTVTTASSPGAATVATVFDVTNPGGNDTTYVAKVVLEPSYQVTPLSEARQVCSTVSKVQYS